ncbi:GH3 family domain-containing protein [Fodinibius halophilus]|uniref:GH3 auxin-responsive promoter family protein n=1 Tax=Fodinibius halophilus TaxID=1736908 RepID=A0A6M1T8W1_9BACT|nr:GH3 auxin-responsive promoter family protein [Fodinibius halophilus]NGP86822.1 GH3 auxin-responsive promoter family protein [Fodinibius halophilus]
MTLRDYQEEQLFILIRAARETKFGRQHRFSELQRYEDFCQEVPLSFFKNIAEEIEQLKEGAENILWPGSISQFAISAGTSGDGKHLPLPDSRLASDQRFMRKVVWSYLKQRPNIFRLWGKHVSLPGTLEQHDGYDTGEISAFTACNVPWWLSPFQLIDTQQLVTLPFQEKIDRIVEEAITNDVRVITAVPSWMLTIFQRVLNKTGTNCIKEIWPNLSLLVCGGVKLEHYCSHLQNLIQNSDVDFIETYGASEGYFAYRDDLQKNDMKLVIDNGVFYEFIPNPLPDKNSIAIQQAVPIWEVQPGIPYAMVVTTNAGLWRYALNDIVEFTQTDPPRINVMGRVSEMLDDYGEALYSYEAREALTKAAENLDIETCSFTIGATLQDKHSIPRHFWFIQSPAPLHPDTLDRLAEKVDSILQESNRHYAIRRESDALALPKFHTISQQQINNWLNQQGKQKAQGKLPAILQDEEDIKFFS